MVQNSGEGIEKGNPIYNNKVQAINKLMHISEHQMFVLTISKSWQNSIIPKIDIINMTFNKNPILFGFVNNNN